MAKLKKKKGKKQAKKRSIKLQKVVRHYQKLTKLQRRLLFSGLLIVLCGSAAIMALTLPQARASAVASLLYPSDLRMLYARTVQNVEKLEKRQTAQGSSLVSSKQLSTMISQAQLDAGNHDYNAATDDLRQLQTALDNWNLELSGGSQDVAGTPAAQAEAHFLPILIYHYTPPDFDQQLTYLETHNYTVIDLARARAGLAGRETLPEKPVVLTFDDGFESQMSAFAILQRHHMTATFYIINGSERSLWCIGASRRYNDPLQPARGCGDAYLTWDQVRELDRAGMTIGGHTMDHDNLAASSESLQHTEIFDSKAAIEGEIGHPIYDFAYPYGAFTQTTINLVREAGYETAVTTEEGTDQAPGTEFTLRRVRDTLTLP